MDEKKGETAVEKYIVHGGNKLTGKIEVSGAKNAAVAILPATILASGIYNIENVPQISDIFALTNILQTLGAECVWLDQSTLQIDTTHVVSRTLPASLSKCLRASYYFVGSLLGRFNYAKVATPGGCQFGATRPIDMHIKGFEALGAKIPPADEEADDEIIIAKADNLLGAYIYLDKVSVGATINIMLAAVRARGRTVIENAAREPHVVDLAVFLNKMGAHINGAGTNTIKIEGCPDLHATDYSIIPDQIEAGTYMVAAAATRGELTVCNVIPKHLESIAAKLRECGVSVQENDDDSITVSASGPLRPCHVKTQPHPGFPTDMQSQLSALLCTANGQSMIRETIFEGRFQVVPELRKMGASIEVSDDVIFIDGVKQLSGKSVEAKELRGSAALLIAGLAAAGTTVVDTDKYLKRGYQDIVGDLQLLGAKIDRVL